MVVVQQFDTWCNGWNGFNLILRDICWCPRMFPLRFWFQWSPIATIYSTIYRDHHGSVSSSYPATRNFSSIWVVHTFANYFGWPNPFKTKTIIKVFEHGMSSKIAVLNAQTRDAASDYKGLFAIWNQQVKVVGSQHFIFIPSINYAFFSTLITHFNPHEVSVYCHTNNSLLVTTYSWLLTSTKYPWITMTYPAYPLISHEISMTDSSFPCTPIQHPFITIQHLLIPMKSQWIIMLNNQWEFQERS